MPEGPELRILRDQLQVIVGHYVLSLEMEKWLSKKHSLPSFYPAKIRAIESKGKKLCFIFDSGQLVVSLGMEGHFAWGKPKHLGASLTIGMPLEFTLGFPIEWQIFSLTKMVYYGDSRHFGHFQWYPNGIEIDVGYDLLASSLVNQNETLDNALKLWRGWKRRFPDWQLCQALMSQKLFAGIGNYCKSECMYRARIRPDRLLKDLTENEDLVILNEAILILLEAYRAGGTTLFTFTGMEEESGPYVNQLQVYRRKTDNFGYTVKQVELKDKRTSHFVPELQK